MKYQKYITAIMTCYNDSKYVGEALDSLIFQTRKPNIIIVLDDASTDDSWEILKKYSAKYPIVKIERNNLNCGTVKTRNKLLALIPKQTDYVAILDSDDISFLDRLEIQEEYLNNNRFIAGCTGAIEIINELGNIIGRKIHHINDDIKRYTIYWNPFVQSSMMLRWEDWNKVGKYDEYFERGEDHEMWLRMLNKNKQLKVLDNILVKYRVHKSQGKWLLSRKSFFNYAKVRLRYLFKPGFFSFRAIFITMFYFVASIIPSSIMIWLYKNIYVKER